MMQKQKRRATFPRATGAFLFFFFEGGRSFLLFAFQPPTPKRSSKVFLLRGGPPPKTTPDTTHTLGVCVCVPSGFSSWLRGHSKQPSSCWAEPAVAVPQQQNRSVNSKKKEEFQFLDLFEGNFQLEHHFLTNLERINGNSSISWLKCRKLGIWRNEWTN